MLLHFVLKTPSIYNAKCEISNIEFCSLGIAVDTVWFWRIAKSYLFVISYLQTNPSLEVKYSCNQRRLIAIVSLTVKQLNKINKFNRLINILYRDFTGVNCCLYLFADIKIRHRIP